MNAPAWLPDWRDPDQYGKPKRVIETVDGDRRIVVADKLQLWTDLAEWRWQFLRRLPEYQIAYQYIPELSDDEHDDAVFRNVDPINALKESTPEIRERFGLDWLPHPAKDYVTGDITGMKAPIVIEDMLNWNDLKRYRDTGYIVTLIDPAQNLDEQVKKLKLTLKTFRPKNETRLPRRPGPDKMLLYLRVLDAKAIGAKSAQICATLKTSDASDLIYNARNFQKRISIRD